MRNAAQALVETLRLHGVDRVFCVPGESYIAVLDSLADAPDIHVVTARHEAGAGFMALTDAKLTGRPGTCFVSRGPGATNASIAVHTAEQDADPLVLFVGQIERKDRGRGAFQEVDYRQTFGDMAKWVAEVDDPARLPEVAARAYHLACSGTPGPVVIALPEDMLFDATEAPAEPPRERPRALPAAAEAWALPVAPSFKHQDLFPNAHPFFAGHLGYGIPPMLGQALAEADLVLAVGSRLGDVTSQGFSVPHAAQPLIHVYPDAAAIGRNFPAERAVVSDAEAFVEALSARNAPRRRREGRRGRRGCTKFTPSLPFGNRFRRRTASISAMWSRRCATSSRTTPS